MAITVAGKTLDFQGLIQFLEKDPTYYARNFPNTAYAQYLQDLNDAYMARYSQADLDSMGPDEVKEVIQQAGSSSLAYASSVGVFDDDTAKSLALAKLALADDDADADAGTGDPKLTAADDERFGLRGPSAQIYGWEGGQPGQYQQFQGLLPDTPGYGGLSGYGQRAFQNQFAPLAAGFALQNIASPFAVEWGTTGADILPEGFTPTPSGVGDAETGLATTGQSFYDYARNPQTGFGSGLPNIFTGFDPSLTVPTSGPTRQQYTNIFGQLAPFFAGDTQEDLFAQATQSQQNVLDWVKNRDIAENLITQYALQGVDPMFRNIFQQKRLQPAFSQFYTDPALLTQPGGLMGRFLTQGIGGTGGQDPWLGGLQRWG